MLNEGIDLLMELISRSHYIVALTGAGISTASGVSDFRGHGGIYNREGGVSEDIFDIKKFKADPSYFYANIGELFVSSANAKPNLGHFFLKKLEDLGKLKSVVTQNVDGLHGTAGNSYVLELHGTFRTFLDMETGESFPLDEKIIKTVVDGKVPKNKAGHVLRPNIVFFGEPVRGLEKALTEVQKADLVLCLGTTLKVYPVSTLPSYLQDDAKLVIINKGETTYDSHAHLVINKDINTVVEKTGLF